VSAGSDYTAVRYPPQAKNKFAIIVIKPLQGDFVEDAALFPNLLWVDLERKNNYYVLLFIIMFIILLLCSLAVLTL